MQNEVAMKRLIITAIFASVLLDWWVSLSIYTVGMTIGEFGIYLLNGLPFDALHAIASIASAVWIAPWLANLLHEETAELAEPIASGESDVITA